MNFDHIDIGFESLSFFQENKKADFQKINQLLKAQSGIVDFFEKEIANPLLRLWFVILT
jgi:hypothetical protein